MAPKVVIITGCSSGIGLETAVLLASDKENRFKVFATMRNLAKKDQLQSTAGSTLDKTLFIRQLDVTDEESINKFMDKINQEEKRVDILINNAGIGQCGVLEMVTMTQIRKVFETNVFGFIRMTQAVIPGMKTKRSGQIINVGSTLGLAGIPWSDIYSSSKFAIEGFSESIAPVLKKFNISISVIEPGPVITQAFANIDANGTGHMGSDAQMDPDVDELTHKLFKNSMDNNAIRIGKMIQTAEEIANVIQDVILTEKPHFRYITSESYKQVGHPC
ncbi:retinol dehydrogenase 8-like isoform X2 [Amphiura filiformis]|uniref:retinol dehydrogenase 8-like isoform X2 n=1 Tax=Amphiura filiformis TaxID=82378 RepID=UPI003B20BBE2